MSSFATVQDITSRWRALTPAETSRAAVLLDDISEALRYEATKVGKDLDEMIEESASYESVVRSVTVDIVARILRQNTEGEAMSQESQSALGYSWSGTYAVPGGGSMNAIMKNDLKRLGFKVQRLGAIDLCSEE